MKPLRVALVGGDPKRLVVLVEGVVVQAFGSARDVGTGELKRLQQSIRSGALDLVVVLARFVGHSMYDVVRDECRRARVRCRLLPCGASGLVKHLRALVEG